MGKCYSIIETQCDEYMLTNLTKDVSKFTWKKKALVKVVSVYDGDTFQIVMKTSFWGNYRRFSCRLLDVDCPELRTKNMKEKELGIKAKNLTKTFVLNKVIQLDITGEDKYGRLLVRYDILSNALIKEGLGTAYDGTGKKYWDTLYDEEP